jgi:hypothetical protein
MQSVRPLHDSQFSLSRSIRGVSPSKHGSPSPHSTSRGAAGGAGHHAAVARWGRRPVRASTPADRSPRGVGHTLGAASRGADVASAQTPQGGSGSGDGSAGGHNAAPSLLPSDGGGTTSPQLGALSHLQQSIAEVRHLGVTLRCVATAWEHNGYAAVGLVS